MQSLHLLKCLSTSVALSLCILPALSRAQQDRDTGTNQAKYSPASLCGNYGAIATHGPNIARALGFELMDGHGNITGAALVNQPGADNTTRSLATVGISGTYTGNAQDMGKRTSPSCFPPAQQQPSSKIL